MSQDPFSMVLSNRRRRQTPLASDLCAEKELLPTILNEVRTFCGTHVDGTRIDSERALGADLLSGVGERGWFGLTVPTRFGGSGLSVGGATRVISELAASNGSLGTCVGLHSGLAMHALLHIGTPAAQERFLPELALGKRIAAFAATEPNAGSDISAVRTRLSEKNGKLRLDGSKCYVTNGGICGALTVLSQSPGLGGARAGHTLVLVDPRTPGVTVCREENKLGLKGSSTVAIVFEGVEIPYDQVLGELSKGLDYAHQALSWGRTFMAAGCIGSARAAVLDVVEHTRQRQQFGRALIAFPLVRESIARARAEVYAMESTLRLVCMLADSGHDEPLVASTMLKVLASEGAWGVVDRALQLMGGTGYMEDACMARRLRDVRVTRIFEGANDVLRMSLAASALTWPVAQFDELCRDAFHLPEERSAEARAWQHTCTHLASTINALKKLWGVRLFEQQIIAADLADGIIFTFSALAVLERMRAEADGDLAVARLALAIQLERANANLTRASQARETSFTELLAAVAG